MESIIRKNSQASIGGLQRMLLAAQQRATDQVNAEKIGAGQMKIGGPDPLTIWVDTKNLEMLVGDRSQHPHFRQWVNIYFPVMNQSPRGSKMSHLGVIEANEKGAALVLAMNAKTYPGPFDGVNFMGMGSVYNDPQNVIDLIQYHDTDRSGTVGKVGRIESTRFFRIKSFPDIVPYNKNKVKGRLEGFEGICVTDQGDRLVARPEDLPWMTAAVIHGYEYVRGEFSGG